MMRALHLLKTSHGARWALRQMRELRNLGVEIHVVLPAGGPLVVDCEAAGLHVHVTDPDVPRGRLRLLRALVDDIAPDLIHSHFVSTTVGARLGLGRWHPIPRLFQVPGPLHLEHAFFRNAEIATAGPRDAYIASCRWTYARYLKSGIPSDRVHLSYYGSDVDSRPRRAHGRLRAELGLAPGTKLVGMVAYIYAPKLYLGQRRGIKGHEDLIDAMRLFEKADDAHCVMIGGAWGEARGYEAKVREYAARRAPGRVTFLGTRDDVAQLYPEFDVAVHPSHSENVGGAVESLLAEVPTIATNVGGLPDLVRPDVTGWLVPPKDPRSIHAALVEALSAPAHAKELAIAGRALAADLLDVRKNARDVFSIYKQTLRGLKK